MIDAPQSIDALRALLKELDGLAFEGYRRLLNLTFSHRTFRLRLIHIQGSPGAFPASVGHLTIRKSELGLTDANLSNSARRLATADFILRALHAGITTHARQNRGAQGSGSFQSQPLPPQVLERNVVKFDSEEVRIAFHISLPGSEENRILGAQAARMLTREMTAIVRELKASVGQGDRLKVHCDIIEDWVALQRSLSRWGLVAFVGDGAILPRQSAVSQAPLKVDPIAFQAPDQLAVEVELPNSGRMRGLGIRPGVNAIIGGAFHGKSTLLNALAKSIYPHVPGDGRERVVTHPDAMVICAEEGRAVHDLDISGFIDNLPGGVCAKRFRTRNASGSTSEAAATIEAILAGAKLLLIDEDDSASNFLIKDRNMRELIPEDPITPLFDRVRELYERHGISTLIAVGGSSACLGAAQQVIAMQGYRPVCLKDRLRRLVLPVPETPTEPMVISDNRRVLNDNFDPCYQAQRLGRKVSVRIKPLRLQEKILEYGDEQLDLTRLTALVDPQQVLAIGYALLLARTTFPDRSLSPSELAAALNALIARQGLEILIPNQGSPLFLARPRQLELAGAINRLRSLKVA